MRLAYGLLALGLLCSLPSVSHARRAVVITTYPQDRWYGPGFYYGTWYDNEDAYLTWRRRYSYYPSNRYYYSRYHRIYYRQESYYRHGHRYRHR